MSKVFHSVCISALILSVIPARGETQPDEAQRDLKKLQGTWQMVRATIDGDPLGEDQVKKCRFVVAGDKFTLTVDKQTSKGTIKIDASKTPKRLGIVPPNDRKKRGILHMIYHLDGDELRTCHTGEPDKDPPTEFVSKKGSGGEKGTFYFSRKSRMSSFSLLFSVSAFSVEPARWIGRG